VALFSTPVKKPNYKIYEEFGWVYRPGRGSGYTSDLNFNACLEDALNSFFSNDLTSDEKAIAKSLALQYGSVTLEAGGEFEHSIYFDLSIHVYRVDLNPFEPGYGSLLKCPNCEENLLHHSELPLWSAKEVAGNDEVPSIGIKFTCENCTDSLLFCLKIRQHKGNTYLYWEKRV
jgi:hypothetical protein